jgi:hypothetical protein
MNLQANIRTWCLLIQPWVLPPDCHNRWLDRAWGGGVNTPIIILHLHNVATFTPHMCMFSYKQFDSTWKFKWHTTNCSSIIKLHEVTVQVTHSETKCNALWNVTTCSLAKACRHFTRTRCRQKTAIVIYPDDGSSKFLRNADTFLPDYMTSLLGRRQTS